MLTHFAGYESVHEGFHYAAKNGPTGAAWGLMHIPVMMHNPVKDGTNEHEEQAYNWELWDCVLGELRERPGKTLVV